VPLSETDRLIAFDLQERLGDEATPQTMLVFGARLRGDNRADMDLCLIFATVDGNLLSRIEQLAWEVGFDHGVTLCPLVVSSTEFDSAPPESLIDRIHRDGIAV
jgi:hypothetical protein